MRTAAWEPGPHKALRDCSKEAVGEGEDVGEDGVQCNQELTLQKVFC